MACWEMAKGSARAETVEGPCIRRCRMARRVGSESAAKAWFRVSKTVWLYIVGWKSSQKNGSEDPPLQKRCHGEAARCGADVRGRGKGAQAGVPVLLKFHVGGDAAHFDWLTIEHARSIFPLENCFFCGFSE